MKIQDIILDKDTPHSLDVNFDAAWELVKKNCTQSLKAVRDTENFLYRGTRNASENIILGQPRADRKVVGSVGSDRSTQAYAETCDLYLKMMGFEALRLSSIFCTVSFQYACAWGTPYIIFPLDGFKFTYSDNNSMCPATAYFNCFTSRHLEDMNSRVVYSIEHGYQIPLEERTVKSLAHVFCMENEFRKSDIEHAMSRDRDIWFTGRFLAFHHSLKKEIDRKIWNMDVGVV